MAQSTIPLDFLGSSKQPKPMLGSMAGTRSAIHSDMMPAMEFQNTGFMLPAVADPADYCRTNYKIKYHEDNGQQITFAKGTTTLAFIYNGGIIVAVDSRSTMGKFISSQTVQKINEINDYLLATIAGGAADCQFWQRNLTIQCRMYELRNRHRISIRAASKMIANTCNYYKKYGMSMGMMMMGYDKGVPTLYYVDDEGSRMKASSERPKFSVGSGSTYAYGILDSAWKWDMDDQEAIDLGARAIYNATHRDAYSGGICNVYHFKPDGYTRIIREDVLKLHEKYGPRG